jgi:hypothetical protein
MNRDSSFFPNPHSAWVAAPEFSVRPNDAGSEIPYDKMFPGFSKIVEERIRRALQKGEFKNLVGSGQPLVLEDDRHIPEELRLAYKILKNADCLPPEVELKKEIERTEDLLSGMQDTAEKYRTLKKLNFLIMYLNTMRKGSIEFEVPQQYSTKLAQRFEAANATKTTKKRDLP